MKPDLPEVTLASASPRRAELLRILLPEFSIQPADIDETRGSGESPRDHVARLAREKARAVADTRPGALVLGSDTVVVLDNAPLGKPAGPDQARSMLAALSGGEHQVMTSVALVGPGVLLEALSVTRVFMDCLPADWIESYIASGEPMDKAGAYGIQGAAAAWIPRIDGSHSAVMGLPLHETARILRRGGVPAGGGGKRG